MLPDKRTCDKLLISYKYNTLSSVNIMVSSVYLLVSFQIQVTSEFLKVFARGLVGGLVPASKPPPR